MVLIRLIAVVSGRCTGSPGEAFKSGRAGLFFRSGQADAPKTGARSLPPLAQASAARSRHARRCRSRRYGFESIFFLPTLYHYAVCRSMNDSAGTRSSRDPVQSISNSPTRE